MLSDKNKPNFSPNYVNSTEMDPVRVNDSDLEDLGDASEFLPSNLTPGLENDVLQSTPSQAELALVIIPVSLSIVNITLNALNVMVARSNRLAMPISNRIAIVSMSVADLLVGVLVIMKAIFYTIWGQSICRVGNRIAATCARASMVSLIFVIVDRYFAIVYPFRHQRYATKKNSIVVIIIFAWLLPAIGTIAEYAAGNFYYDPYRKICAIEISTTAVIISLTMEYLAPLVLMIGVYFRLLIVVRQLTRKMARIYPCIPPRQSATVPSTISGAAQSANAGAALSAQDSSTVTHRRRGAPHNDYREILKVTLTFFAICLAYGLTRIPSHVVQLTTVVRRNPPAVWLISVTRIIYVTGTWWNFIILSLFNRNFRIVLKQLFQRSN